MAKSLKFIIWAFSFSLSLLTPNPTLSQLTHFTYNGFKTNLITNKNTTNIELNGVAEIKKNGLLMLTRASPSLIGRAFYPNLVKFKNPKEKKPFSFSTAFVFNIIPQYANLGGHGFAFIVSLTKDFPKSLPRQCLGLVNQTDNGNSSNQFFAIEFDTVQDYQYRDINGNHIGIDINGLVSIASVNASYFEKGNSTKKELNLKSGQTIQAWIDYHSEKNELNVTLSLSSTKPESPILSIECDLSQVLEEYMYVGFSASTGLLASYHYIKGWSFQINGEAESLNFNSLPSLPGRKQKTKQKQKQIVIGVSVFALFFIAFSVVIALFLIKRRSKQDIIEPWEIDIGPHRFSYKELEKATKGFKDKELLGFGGSGRVYKGILPDSSTQIAVKRISNESKQGVHSFVSEIATIGRLRHRNLVQLMGWCRKRNELLIVYDFMPNGSLDKYIFDKPKMILTWKQRLKIIKGVASGLLYLHEGWKQSVIHRDIKAGNVLLDSEMNGKLGDFGLAKLYEHGSNPSTTKVVGTLGYLAPELTRTGKPNTASDVFAFGALLLEVVCGRRPIERKAMLEELFLVEWVHEKWKDGKVLEVVDVRLREEFDKTEAVLVIKLGLMCSNSLPWKRPSMRDVMGYLEGVVELPDDVAPPYECEGRGLNLRVSTYA